MRTFFGRKASSRPPAPTRTLMWHPLKGFYWVKAKQPAIGGKEALLPAPPESIAAPNPTPLKTDQAPKPEQLPPVNPSKLDSQKALEFPRRSVQYDNHLPGDNPWWQPDYWQSLWTTPLSMSAKKRESDPEQSADNKQPASPISPVWQTNNWQSFWTNLQPPSRSKEDQAASASSKEDLLLEAIELYEDALSGDKEAVDEALEILEELRNLDPQDPLVEAFYGSTIALLARDSVDPRERLSKGIQGHRILTQAVEKDPANIWARILRAFVSYRLPEEFFHRTHIAIEDFNYLVARYQEDPKVLTPDFYWEILYHLGRAYRNMDLIQESKSIWTKLWKETTDNMYRKLLKNEGFQPTEVAAENPSSPAASYKNTEPDIIAPVSSRPWTQYISATQTPAETIANNNQLEQPASNIPANILEKESALTSEQLRPQTDAASPNITAEMKIPEQTSNLNTSISDILRDTAKSVAFSSNKKTAYDQVDRSQLQEGINLHARAREGDREATRTAFEFFKRLNSIYPDDDLVAIYYADCLSMTGRDTADSSVQFANAISAIMTMEKVVGRHPDNIEMRLIRGYHGFRLPEAFFRRTRTAIEDFEYVIQRYEQDQTLLSSETYWQLLFDLGKAFQRLGDDEKTKAIWKKLFFLAPDSKIRNSIRFQDFDAVAELQELTQSDDPQELLQAGIRLFRKAVDGNSSASAVAHGILKKAYEIEPENLEILAYYGSSIALLGRDSADAGVMFDNGIKGMRMLNKAINRDPNNAIFRILRAYLTSSMPESFFHMTEGAIEDFRFAISAYEQDSNLFPVELYWKLLYDLGTAYARIDQFENAKKIWTVLSAQSSDPQYQNLVN